MEIEKLLKELGKYLERKGWKVLLIEEEGILQGDTGKKNSFRLSFKFIGKKKIKTEEKVKEFLDTYEKFKVSDTLCIKHSNVKDFLTAMEKYYLKLKTEVRNSSHA